MKLVANYLLIHITAIESVDSLYFQTNQSNPIIKNVETIIVTTV